MPFYGKKGTRDCGCEVSRNVFFASPLGTDKTTILSRASVAFASERAEYG